MNKWVICTSAQYEQAEKTMFARWLRYTIMERGKSTAWNIQLKQSDDISVMADSELIPDKYPILGNTNEVLNKDKGYITGILNFKETVGGNYSAEFPTIHKQKTYLVDENGDNVWNMIEVSTSSMLDGIEYVEYTETKPEFKEL